MPDYTQFEDSAPCSEQGFYVGAKGSEVVVISSSGELTNQVAKTDAFVVLGPEQCVFSGGTWTLTRNAASDYSMNKTAGANTTYISADITEILRAATSKGMKLTSFDYAYFIGTDVVTTHGRVVNGVTYANNTAVAVAAHGGTLSGSLATATQANPYLTTVTLGTPAFANTADTKINIEISVVATATLVYKFYGIILNFTYDPL